jgi:hypothetical protein
MPNLRTWSDALGWRLLSSLPEAELVGQWGPISTDAGDRPGGFGDSLRRDLLSWARQDDEVRRWILGAWRELHPDLVAAADQAVLEGLTGDSVRELASFPSEDALLALLTDEFDDGRELAKTFLNRVAQVGKRQALFAALDRLVGDGARASLRRPRVVVFGGRQRDERKLDKRLFENSPFDVRWKAFEKKPSSGVVQRGVVSVLRNADAIIIITGMISHMLMQFAKDCAQRSGIRWKCVEKATDIQLKAALQEMFPELIAGWA